MLFASKHGGLFHHLDPVVVIGLFIIGFCAAVFWTLLKSPKPSSPAGCRKVSVAKRSSLEDEFDSTYRAAKVNASGDERPEAKIKGLFVYPIKSCHGVEVNEVEVKEYGCKYDRDFVFAQHMLRMDEKTQETSSAWEFITQRKFPRLNHVVIDIWEPDPTAAGHHPDAEFVQSQGCMDVSFPRITDLNPLSLSGLKSVLANVPAMLSQLSLSPVTQVSFRVPYIPTTSMIKQKGLTRHKVQIWAAWPTGIDLGAFIPPDVLEELRLFLRVDKPITLFRKDPQVVREVHRNADDIQDLGYQANTNFADSFPINLLGVSSVQDVGEHVKKGPAHKLSAARFRSNFLIEGTAPFEEEKWKSIYLSDSGTSPLLFHVTNRATRCSLPCVDPHQQDPRLPNVLKHKQPGFMEPLTTLRQYRAVDEGAPSDGCVGMMAVPDGTVIGEKVRVGMRIQVREEGKHVIKR